MFKKKEPFLEPIKENLVCINHTFQSFDFSKFFVSDFFLKDFVGTHQGQRGRRGIRDEGSHRAERSERIHPLTHCSAARPRGNCRDTDRARRMRGHSK